ncbi:MAG: RluA family pseudouridine synthase [Saprospiraceae bacterium]|nr:RluA family pseudouridine synthase [Saprospiraceae bacterium]
MEVEDLEDDLLDQIVIRVDAGQQPLRIDKFLLDKLQKLSRSKIQSGISSGSVRVNEETVKSNYKVRPHDHIEIVVPRRSPDAGILVGENIAIDIIYEDEDVLVINKPAGMVVHPGVGNRNGTLVNALVYHLHGSDLPVLDGNSDDRPGLVHRIDKDTSGLLVTAKNEYSLSHLARQFFNHSTQRTYLALVWGEPQAGEGTIRNYIGRDLKERTRQKVFEDEELGKLAVTHYQVIEPLYYVSLLNCQLETGRTHQIRVHLSHLGHPLFGDEKYGGNRIVKGTVFQKYKQFVQNCLKVMPHQALHAQSLGFTHPRSGERMQFQVDPPPAFQELLNKWRGYVNSRKSKLQDE